METFSHSFSYFYQFKKLFHIDFLLFWSQTYYFKAFIFGLIKFNWFISILIESLHA